MLGQPGARDALLTGMEFDQDAYNSIGDHLTNDQKQSHWFMLLLVLVSIPIVALLVWTIYL